MGDQDKVKEGEKKNQPPQQENSKRKEVSKAITPNNTTPQDATKLVQPAPLKAIPPAKAPVPENQNKVNVSGSVGASIAGIEINSDGSAGYKGVTVSKSGVDLVLFSVSQTTTTTIVQEPFVENTTRPVEYKKVVSTVKAGFLLRGASQRTEIYRDGQLVSASESSGISIGYKRGITKGIEVGGEIDLYSKAK